MEKFKKIFREHWLVLLGAFFIGCLIILPTILSIQRIGLKNFQGVYPVFVDDGEYYLARVNDLRKGFALGNPYFYEHRNGPYVQPPLAEFILAKTSDFLHVSVPAFMAGGSFLFPFCGVIVLYILFYHITGSKLTSFFFSFLYYLYFFREFGRLLNPHFSFIFLVISIIFIWKIFSNSAGNRQIIIYNLVVSSMFGLLLYMQPYFWTTLMAFYGSCLILNIIFNKKEVLYYLKNFTALIGFSLLFAIPYLFNQADLSSRQPEYSEILSRFGMIFNHWPACYYNAALLFFAFILVYVARKQISQTRLIFAYASILCGFLLIWQNVITGTYIQFSGHYIYSVVLLATIVFAVIMGAAWEIIKSRQRPRSWLLVSATIIFCLACFFPFNRIVAGDKKLFAGASGEEMLSLQNQKNLLNWINQNTEAGSVFFAPEYYYYVHLIPIYTNAYLYSYAGGGLYLVGDEEMEDRWVRQNIFKDDIGHDYIFNNSRIIWQNKFIDNYQNKLMREKIFAKLTSRDEKNIEFMPQFYIDRVAEEYKDVKKQDTLSALKKFKIDYIILDNSDENYAAIDAELGKYEEIKKIMDIDGSVIYRVE